MKDKVQMIKEIFEELLNEALDLVNDAETKVVDLDLYKELMNQLEHLYELLEEEPDLEKRRSLIAEVRTIYIEIYNVLITEVCREFLLRRLSL